MLTWKSSSPSSSPAQEFATGLLSLSSPPPVETSFDPPDNIISHLCSHIWGGASTEWHEAKTQNMLQINFTSSCSRLWFPSAWNTKIFSICLICNTRALHWDDIIQVDCWPIQYWRLTFTISVQIVQFSEWSAREFIWSTLQFHYLLLCTAVHCTYCDRVLYRLLRRSPLGALYVPSDGSQHPFFELFLSSMPQCH